MSSSTSAPVAKPLIVPLARDANGRPLPVPPDAAFWRVRRHTRGRPRNVIGADRRHVELPLDFTEDDLEAMFGAGTYRLDLYDAAGEPLDLTVTVPLGEPEPANVKEPADDAAAIAPALPANASDVRLVLEANVRATQLAFAHNERTLTASLRMADTLRDGIRDLASAQATWINTLASARGFFRNAQPAVISVASRASGHDEHDSARDDDDQDSEDEATAASTNIYDVLMPFAEQAAPMLPLLAGGALGAKPAADGVASPEAAPVEETSADVELEGKPWELRELVDLRYAAAKGQAKDATRVRTPQPATSAMPLQARIMADPTLLAHVMSVKELLTSAEIAELFELASTISDSEQQAVVDMLSQNSPERAAHLIRYVLDERRGHALAAQPAPMQIKPVRVPASEAIPGTPPPASDVHTEPTANAKP